MIHARGHPCSRVRLARAPQGLTRRCQFFGGAFHHVEVAKVEASSRDPRRRPFSNSAARRTPRGTRARHAGRGDERVSTPARLDASDAPRSVGEVARGSARGACVGGRARQLRPPQIDARGEPRARHPRRPGRRRAVRRRVSPTGRPLTILRVRPRPRDASAKRPARTLGRDDRGGSASPRRRPSRQPRATTRIRHPRARRLLGARVAGADPQPRRQFPGRIRATHAPPPAPAADPSRCGVGARTRHPSSASEIERRFVPASQTPGSLRIQAHRRRPRPSAPSTRKHRRRADGHRVGIITAYHRVGIITAYARRADRPSPRTGPRGVVVVFAFAADVVGIGIRF